jgi:hypothetical protein
MWGKRTGWRGVAIPPLAVPTSGWLRTRCSVLGRIIVYQVSLSLWHRTKHHLPLNAGMSSSLRAE